jgi:hypothetical protein
MNIVAVFRVLAKAYMAFRAAPINRQMIGPDCG